MARPLREGNNFSRPDWNYTLVVKRIIREKPPRGKIEMKDNGQPGCITTLEAQKMDGTREIKTFQMRTIYDPVVFEMFVFEDTFIRPWAMGIHAGKK